MGNEAELEVLRLAQSQHGVLCRRQARAEGMTDRQIGHRLATGRWVRVLPSVFRVEGAPVTWRQRLTAAELWVSTNSRATRRVPDYALSHRAAAALHGFERYVSRDEDAQAVELSCTRHLRATGEVKVHWVDTLSHHDVQEIDGIRVTTPTRTLLDLATIEPPENVRDAVNYALTRKLTTVEKLDAALKRVPRERGTKFLKALVVDLQGGNGPTESQLESKVLELLEECGLPRPVCQRRVMANGRTRRLDFLIPGTPVVIEADSYAYHSSIDVFEKDRERINSLIARGYRVLHWTWKSLLERPEELVRQLAQVLATP